MCKLDCMEDAPISAASVQHTMRPALLHYYLTQECRQWLNKLIYASQSTPCVDTTIIHSIQTSITTGKLDLPLLISTLTISQTSCQYQIKLLHFHSGQSEIFSLNGSHIKLTSLVHNLQRAGKAFCGNINGRLIRLTQSWTGSPSALPLDLKWHICDVASLQHLVFNLHQPFKMLMRFV